MWFLLKFCLLFWFVLWCLWIWLRICRGVARTRLNSRAFRYFSDRWLRFLVNYVWCFCNYLLLLNILLNYYIVLVFICIYCWVFGKCMRRFEFFFRRSRSSFTRTRVARWLNCYWFVVLFLFVFLLILCDLFYIVSLLLLCLILVMIFRDIVLSFRRNFFFARVASFRRVVLLCF